MVAQLSSEQAFPFKRKLYLLLLLYLLRDQPHTSNTILFPFIAPGALQKRKRRALIRSTFA
jgi:hypothetical protein